MMFYLYVYLYVLFQRDCALCLSDVKNYRSSQHEVFFIEDVVRVITSEAPIRGALQKKSVLKTTTQVLSCEISKIFKNTYFQEHL